MYRGYVQLVHEAFDCFDRGDWERLRPLITAGNVMTPLETWPDPGPFIGPDASIREYQRLFEMFDGIEVTVSGIVSREARAIAHYRGAIEDPARDQPEEIQFTGVHRFEGDQFAESHYRFRPGQGPGRSRPIKSPRRSREGRPPGATLWLTNQPQRVSPWRVGFRTAARCLVQW